ncbi:MAG: lipoate--protein ligase family protein [Candidatus Marsarchaeota archaeon]|nr:lipoate--protein ligase family protein [Candidatus Marsarchaeota archaeon]
MQVSSMYKAEKGLIKISADVEGETIRSIRITGDFFLIPEESIVELERSLVGKRLDEEALNETVGRFYSTGIVSPSMTKEDLVKAILGVKNGV